MINHELFAKSSTGPVSFEIPGMCLTVSNGQKISDAKLSVSYDEQLNLRISMQSERDFPPTIAFEDHELALSFEDEGLGDFPCITTRVSLGSHKGVAAELLPYRQPIVLDKKIPVFALTGVISNGPNFLIRTLGDLEKVAQYPVVLEFEDWSISIYQFPHTKMSFDNRASLAGRKIVTHWFELVRMDGKAFLGNDPLSMLFNFMDFLSFARGARVGVFHITGSTDLQSSKYARIGSNRHDSFGSPNNWFDYTLTNNSNDIFQAFCNAFKNSQKKQTVRRVIEYYCLGNSMQPMSTESALIMTQAALETLAFSILGSQTFNDSKNGAGMRGAICAAATAVGIATDPAEGLEELKSRITLEGWLDGYRAITEFRNGVTHSRTIKYTGRELVQVWTSAQWLVEVMLLVWLGYEGEFSDRRTKKWVGENVKISTLLVS